MTENHWCKRRGGEWLLLDGQGVKVLKKQSLRDAHLRGWSVTRKEGGETKTNNTGWLWTTATCRWIASRYLSLIVGSNVPTKSQRWRIGYGGDKQFSCQCQKNENVKTVQKNIPRSVIRQLRLVTVRVV